MTMAFAKCEYAIECGKLQKPYSGVFYLPRPQSSQEQEVVKPMRVSPGPHRVVTLVALDIPRHNRGGLMKAVTKCICLGKQQCLQTGFLFSFTIFRIFRKWGRQGRRNHTKNIDVLATGSRTGCFQNSSVLIVFKGFATICL